MGIEMILNERGRMQAILVCDICGDRIEERGDGNVLYAEQGERQSVVLAHKERCSAAEPYMLWRSQELSQAIWEWFHDLLFEGYEPPEVRTSRRGWDL